MSWKTIMRRDELSPFQACGLLFMFMLMMQVIFSAATYFYFTNELKQLAQLQDAKSSLACLTNEYLGDMMGSRVPSASTQQTDAQCLLLKWQLQQVIKKEFLTIYEGSSTRKGLKSNKLSGARETVNQSLIQSVAAHITGTRSSHFRTDSLGRPPVPHIKLYYKKLIIKTIWYWLRNRAIDQWNGKDSQAAEGKVLGSKIYNWEPPRKGYSFQHNMGLLDGELIISHTGYYYIYSQTYFRFQSEEKNKQPKQLIQYIYKVTSYPEPILLLKSVKTSCWAKNSEYGLYSIYQGGVFELRERDRIFVSVSEKELIDMDKEASFFGAFLIG